MNMRVARVLIVVAACLTGLGGCSSSTKLSDLWTSKDNGASSTPATGAEETTGSVVVQPAEPGPSGEPVAPLAKPGLLGDDPHDDLQPVSYTHLDVYKRQTQASASRGCFSTALRKLFSARP